MMVQVQQDYLTIMDKLLLLTCYIKINSINKKYDLNEFSQTIMAEVLNRYYDWYLEDANKKYPNIAGIDLVDEKNKILIQVTSERSTQKINETIKKTKTVVKKYKWQGFTLYILGLFIDNFPKSRKPYTIPKSFNFDEKTNLLNLTKLINIIGTSSNITKRKYVIEYLNEEIQIENPINPYKEYKPIECKSLKKFATILDWDIEDNELKTVPNNVNKYLKALSSISKISREVFSIIIENIDERQTVCLSTIENKLNGDIKKVKNVLDELRQKSFVSDPYHDDDNYNYSISIYGFDDEYNNFWYDLQLFINKTNNLTFDDIIVKLDFSLLD